MPTKIILIIFGAFVSAAGASEISLHEFLEAAWKRSHILEGERFKNEQTDETVSSVRGKYFPHLSLEAIDSNGFPGSSSALHVGGIMGAPYRSGLAGGALLEQTVYDFGRIHSLLKEAKAGRTLAQARLAAEKLRFLSEMGGLYLNCARVRSMRGHYKELRGWAALILKETERFTRTGQRSVIDNRLVQEEVNELDLQEEELNLLQTTLLDEMKMYSSLDGGCGRLSQAWGDGIAHELTVEAPGVLLAQAELEVSTARLENAKAGQLPTLNVIGSYGEMEKSRLVPKQNYAVGVGLIFPVFNGGEDLHREHALNSEAQFQNQAFEESKLEFAAEMKALSDRFQRERAALKRLERDLGQVRVTMQQASSRYRSLEGPLIDVRQAFQSLRKAEEERVQRLFSLAETSLQLKMFNKSP